MQCLDRLVFSQVRHAHPERWEKARPGAAFVNTHDDEPGRYAVRRQGGDWHECTLVVVHDEFAGRCDCDGFQFHDGQCSHLCAVFRLYGDDREHFHRVRPDAYYADLQADAERQAQLRAEPDHRSAATDGGRRP